MFKAVDLNLDQVTPVFETFYDNCAHCERRTLIVRHVSERFSATLCWDCYCDLAAEALCGDVPEACHGDIGRSAADLCLLNNYCQNPHERFQASAEASAPWQTQLGVDPEKLKKNQDT